MRLPLCWLCLWLSGFAAHGDTHVLPLNFPHNGKSGFSRIDSSTSGIAFTNLLAQQRHLTNQILLNGSGVTAGDVDGDGLVDLYFAALDGPNVLYRNLGNFRFQDITASSGTACPDLDATAVAFADLDGDGDLDLVVNSLGRGAHIFFNDGKARFTRSTQPPLNGNLGGMSMALADIDGNGTLDLYIANYRTVSMNDQPNTRFAFRIVDDKPVVSTVNGRPITEPDLVHRYNFKITFQNGQAMFSYDENGEADAMFLNDGRGRFTALSFTQGAFLDERGAPLRQPPFDWGLSVMLRDLNGDGAPDIYVCNDFRSPDRIWINDGQGKFRGAPPRAIRHTSLSSMGVDMADVNRDGHDDIFVVDMLSRDHARRLTQRPDIAPEVFPIGDTESRAQVAQNTLLLARGDGSFADIAFFAGVDASEWSWTPVFLDVDLDGYEDLLVSNGFERDGMNVDVLRELETAKAGKKLPVIEQLGLRRMFPRLETPNVAFRNLGNLKFADFSAEWGFSDAAISQGMALADLDNDGDLDVVINNLNAPPIICRNNTAAPRVAVRLRGQAPNTRGIGAKILVTGGPVPQSGEMICGGRYLSSDDPIRTFAAGSLTNRLQIEVVWRNGRRSVVSDALPNRLYEIEEPSRTEDMKDALGPLTAQRPTTNREPRATFFQDLSSALAHRHIEEAFDDFARQPTLPNRLSQLGPGVSWFDVDGDGADDLIVGSGRGGTLAVFRNETGGRFKRMEGAPYSQPVTRDQTTVLGWKNSARQPVLLAGSSNYEDGMHHGGVLREYNLATKTIENSFPGQDASAGPMAMADVDGDGALDLFVGSRVLPGRYPEAAPSILFRQAAGRFVLDAVNTAALTNAGLVSGAVWSDLNGDGFPELILACEWGPLKIFRNDRGKLTRWNPSVSGSALLTFDSLTGWWNGVTAGDFDGDGRMDIVASNWGENTKYEALRGEPLRIYYGDFDGDGAVETIEAHYEATLKSFAPVRHLDAALRGMPWLRERFPTWASFSRATIEGILGDKFSSAKSLEARWLSSAVFLNRGDQFEIVRLPDEAQFAPGFGVCVADFKGDGSEDIFLSQNFFATTPETPRYDAGRGLWLRGDGKGGFKAVSSSESGITIHGEQRGAALCDFDADGRVDLAVAQNGAETKLYRNTLAKPGLRVRLAGPIGNPAAVGATIRIGNGERLGPAREIHAGAGYWSQDSAVQVLPANGGAKVVVRWPGGKTTTSDIPSGAREISVDPNGQVTVLL